VASKTPLQSGLRSSVRCLRGPAPPGSGQHVGVGRALDALWLALAAAHLSKDRGPLRHPLARADLRFGATCSREQQFFLMLGHPVLQAYGLTETTGICTLDDPRVPVEPGYVGTVITGIEMKLAEHEEIVVRGPHISGYWNRPEETARVLQEDGFHTGDQGEVNVRGNWRIRRPHQKSDHLEFRA